MYAGVPVRSAPLTVPSSAERSSCQSRYENLKESGRCAGRANRAAKVGDFGRQTLSEKDVLGAKIAMQDRVRVKMRNTRGYVGGNKRLAIDAEIVPCLKNAMMQAAI